MIRLSPPDYSFVQVERPVIAGAKQFLATAQDVGRWVLGEEIVSSVTDLSVDFFSGDDDPTDLIHIERPVGTPIFETSAPNDLSLVLMHRGVQRQLASRYGIVPAHGYLSQSVVVSYRTVQLMDGLEKRAKTRRPGLIHDLDQVSTNHGLTPDYTQTYYDRIDQVNEPGGNCIVGLFLTPGKAATRALMEQADVSSERLKDKHKQLAQAKRLAQVVSPAQVTIPFARCPGRISDQQYQRLFDSLREELLPVQLVLGAPRVTSSF